MHENHFFNNNQNKNKKCYDSCFQVDFCQSKFHLDFQLSFISYQIFYEQMNSFQQPCDHSTRLSDIKFLISDMMVRYRHILVMVSCVAIRYHCNMISIHDKGAIQHPNNISWQKNKAPNILYQELHTELQQII